MCRLFGMTAGTQPVSARFWLLEAPDSLEEQSRRNRDGSGIGYFATDGTPVLDKQPEAAFEDVEFIATAREATSTTFLSHVRYATAGTLREENTHPFAMAGRLMAHNGGFGELDALEAELGDAVVEVIGDTDSERYFALITRETSRHGGDVGAGIASAASWIAQTLPLFSLNVIVAQANQLWALRYPDQYELHLLARKAGGHQGGCPLRATSDEVRLHSPELEHHQAVIVSSERMDEHPQWESIAPGELVHVAPDLTVTRKIVLPDPPVRFVPPDLSLHPG